MERTPSVVPTQPVGERVDGWAWPPQGPGQCQPPRPGLPAPALCFSTGPGVSKPGGQQNADAGPRPTGPAQRGRSSVLGAPGDDPSRTAGRASCPGPGEGRGGMAFTHEHRKLPAGHRAVTSGRPSNTSYIKVN